MKGRFEMEIDDLAILTNEIIPPIGRKLKYAAMVQFLYVIDENGRHKVSNDFGETWGQTKKKPKKKCSRKSVTESHPNRMQSNKVE
jgi:hypothetical protein